MTQRTRETETTALDQRTLDDIVQRVVDVAHPEKIILFGSAARGDMNRHSDVDLLIVKDTDDYNLTGEIYGGLRGVGIPIDVVVVSPDDVERYKDSHPLVIKPALREGRTVYESHESNAAGDPQPRTRRAQREPASVREDKTGYEPHERYEPDDPREWLGRARSNLAHARTRNPDVYLEDLCFNAQQAAEKAIKAVMIQRDIEYPYTHDIYDLLGVLEVTGETIPEEVDAARSLSKYAVATRYPGGIPVTTEEYQKALEIAEAVVTWAAARI